MSQKIVHLAALDSTSTSIKASECQKYLASGTRNGKVKLYLVDELLDDIYLEHFDIHEDKVIDIAFLPKNSDDLMITVSQDGFMKICSTLELKEIYKIDTRCQPERVITFKEHTIVMLCVDH